MCKVVQQDTDSATFIGNCWYHEHKETRLGFCSMSISDSVVAYLPRDVGWEWTMYEVGFKVLEKGDAVAEGKEPVSVNFLVMIRKV